MMIVRMAASKRPHQDRRVVYMWCFCFALTVLFAPLLELRYILCWGLLGPGVSAPRLVYMRALWPFVSVVWLELETVRVGRGPVPFVERSPDGGASAGCFFLQSRPRASQWSVLIPGLFLLCFPGVLVRPYVRVLVCSHHKNHQAARVYMYTPQYCTPLHSHSVVVLLPVPVPLLLCTALSVTARACRRRRHAPRHRCPFCRLAVASM